MGGAERIGCRVQAHIGSQSARVQRPTGKAVLLGQDHGSAIAVVRVFDKPIKIVSVEFINCGYTQAFVFAKLDNTV